MVDHSDDAIALVFAERNQGTVCFDVDRSTWLVWDPAAVARSAMWRDGPTVLGDWRPDNTMRAMRLIRDACRAIAADIEDPRKRATILSSAKMRAVERMARTDHRMALDPQERTKLARERRQ